MISLFYPSLCLCASQRGESPQWKLAFSQSVGLTLALVILFINNLFSFFFSLSPKNESIESKTETDYGTLAVKCYYNDITNRLCVLLINGSKITPKDKSGMILY